MKKQRYLEFRIIREYRPCQFGHHISGTVGGGGFRGLPGSIRSSLMAPYLSVFTRTPFVAHSTARLDAMCFTATTGQYHLSRMEPARGESPAFDALYGVCSFAIRSI